MTQLSLVWDCVNPKDEDRAFKLTGDLKMIFDIMSDGQAHLVSDIAFDLNLPECSVSAQIRHLRKSKFGGHKIKRISLTKGLSAYQMILFDNK